jgi:hypothetical protein
LKVLVKNVSNAKATLHEAANQVKNSLVALLTNSQLSSATAFNLLTTLFGPNTLTRLSIRKHLDLLKPITSRMEPEHVKAYLDHMRSLFENP